MTQHLRSDVFYLAIGVYFFLSHKGGEVPDDVWINLEKLHRQDSIA